MSKNLTPHEKFQAVEDAYAYSKKMNCSIVKGCQKVGISRASYFRWVKQYSEKKGTGLINKSRNPKKPFTFVSKTNKNIIYKLAKSGRFRYASEIQKELLEKNAIKLPVNTIIKILEEQNCFDPKPDKILKNPFRLIKHL